jgi:hypothetical protein
LLSKNKAAKLDLEQLIARFDRPEMMTADCLRSMAFHIKETVTADNDWVIEIGTYWGETAAFISRVLMDLPTKYNYLVSIDAFYESTDNTWNDYGEYAIYKAMQRKWGTGDYSFVISATSFMAGQFLKSGCSFIVVDGSHQYDNVYNDIILYRKLLKHKGRMWLHDYSPQYPGLQRAVDELIKEKYAFKQIEQGENHLVAEWYGNA